MASLFIYARVSSLKQSEEGIGIEAQIAECRKYAGDQRLGSPTAVFEDRAISRDSDPQSRPGMSALLGIAKRGDVILAFKRDRLGSDMLALGLLERSLKKRGITLLTAHGDNSDTAEGRLLRQVLDSIADYELESIRSRTRSALRTNREKGLVHARRWLGFSAVDGKWVRNEAEQRVLNRIWSSHSQGKSFSEVARELNQDGIPAPHGGRWHHTSIAKVVRRKTPVLT